MCCALAPEGAAALPQRCMVAQLAVAQDCNLGYADWRVLDDDPQLSLGFPPDPLWTESNWKQGLPSVQVFQVGRFCTRNRSRQAPDCARVSGPGGGAAGERPSAAPACV